VAKQSSGFDHREMQDSNRLSVREERAQTMTEYAVILTMITLAVILAVAFLSTSIGSHVTDLANLVK
jgi:Flp pilus assembly pilin Flp